MFYVVKRYRVRVGLAYRLGKVVNPIWEFNYYHPNILTLVLLLPEYALKNHLFVVLESLSKVASIGF